MEKDLEKQFVESINRLAVRVVQEDKKVITFSSIEKGEGTSTVVSNLARALVEVNKSVVVLDTDMNSVRDVSIPSLVDFLLGKATLKDVLLKDEANDQIISSFWVDSKTLLTSEKYIDLVNSLREAYDYVLIDTSALVDSVDPVLVGRQSDGVVLVVEANKHSKDNLQDHYVGQRSL